MNIEDKLKNEILKNYKSIRAFTLKIEIPYTTLDGILKHGITRAGVSTMIKICNELNISIEALEDNRIQEKTIVTDFSKLEAQHIKKYRNLDGHGKKIVDLVLDEEHERILSYKAVKALEYDYTLDFYNTSVSAGTGMYLSDDYKEQLSVPKTPSTRKADSCIRVSGDSMEPQYHDSDILLIKEQETLEVGDVGVFILNGEGYVKKLGEEQLLSLNKNYPPIELREYDRLDIFGIVLGKI